VLIESVSKLASRMGSLSTGRASTRGFAEPLLGAGAMLENARQASEFLKALSHEGRLLILCLLIEGEKSVTELEQALNLRQAHVSQQLARLRANNLVEARRDGKSIYYSVTRPEVIEIIAVLYRTFCRRDRDGAAHARKRKREVGS
jgi:DNA-binding transcriptional ArsR family regulator